jgi:hypothetical protein
MQHEFAIFSLFQTYAVAVYDAVYIYVRALHGVLKSKNESVADGRAIFKRIVNTTFESELPA